MFYIHRYRRERDAEREREKSSTVVEKLSKHDNLYQLITQLERGGRMKLKWELNDIVDQNGFYWRFKQQL